MSSARKSLEICSMSSVKEKGHFLGDLKTPDNHSEINWPLVLLSWPKSIQVWPNGD